MGIDVQHITKSFGQFKALDDVSIQIQSGELVALLGPSGSGKTTLLRIIAGLEIPDRQSGPIFFDGANVATQKVGDRGVGFVFQHYALFRHMTVYDNIAFGLKVKPRAIRPSKEKIRERVSELLHMIQLDNLSNRYPSQLSGGQRQRVALARALAVEPQVLLLDEPFGALDAKVRIELRAWLRRLHDKIHLTSVFVTHDQDEALELADRVAVMNNGRVEQVGTPTEVFHHPKSLFVVNFLGQVNQFRGRFCRGRLQIGQREGIVANVVSISPPAATSATADFPFVKTSFQTSESPSNEGNALLDSKTSADESSSTASSGTSASTTLETPSTVVNDDSASVESSSSADSSASFVLQDSSKSLKSTDSVKMDKGQEIIDNLKSKWIGKNRKERQENAGNSDEERQNLAAQPDLESNASDIICVRPHDFDISLTDQNDGHLSLPAKVLRVHSAGAHVRVEMMTESNENFVVEMSHQQRELLQIEPGKECYVIPRNAFH